ncbi:MAG: amidohydrolase family protein [Bacteroidales bacterium]|nr:amidohydrolase family protein [Bacteroidales bacterium]
MSLILKNGTFIDYNTLEFKRTNVVISEGSDHISMADSVEAQPGDTIVECSGMYIMHSFADAYMRPSLSLAAQAKVYTKKESTYLRYVTNILWPINKCIDKELLYASALYAALNAVRNGTTFVICRNESQSFIEGSLSVVNAAFNKVGISTLQSFAASETDGYAIAEREIRETANYLESNQGLMGISASFLTSAELLKETAKLCSKYNTGLLVNAAEDNIDQANTMRDHRRSVVMRFYEEGLMDYPSTILANANVITDIERDYIKNKPVWIAHNPCGNFQRGIAPFNSIWLNDIVMLGSDYSMVSMPEAMRHAYFQNIMTDNEIDLKTAYGRLNAVHRYLKKNGFKGDGDNNLIVFENNSPFELDRENFVKHLVFNKDMMDIRLVIANGKIIAKNGHTTLEDEKELIKFIAEQAKRISC